MKQHLFATLAIVAAVLLLGACSKNDDRTAGQKVDAAIASTEQRAAEAKADTKAAIDSTTAKVAVSMEDAAITTSVNAELAKDPDLSALRINVDSDRGQVVLRGKAPSASARERATKLAEAVKGVVRVDNQLVVGS
jgi:osmotically-inducible protein OsmY